jgi:hypothetical protein
VVSEKGQAQCVRQTRLQSGEKGNLSRGITVDMFHINSHALAQPRRNGEAYRCSNLIVALILPYLFKLTSQESRQRVHGRLEQSLRLWAPRPPIPAHNAELAMVDDDIGHGITWFVSTSGGRVTMKVSTS